MRTYRVAGLRVRTEMDLPEVVPVPETPDDWVLELADHPGRPMALDTPYREALLPDGERWLSMAHDGDGYRLRFWGNADFWIGPHLRQVTCTPEPGVPPATIRHLFLDQVVPLLLSTTERVVLHASAVLTEWGAVAFLGESGRGKSTLAASFALEGIPALADDCLVLVERSGGIVVEPMYPGVRLWPDSFHHLATGHSGAGGLVAHYGSKRRFLPAPTVPDGDEPLVAAFILGASEASSRPRVEPVTGPDAFIEVFRSAFRLDDDAAGHPPQFDRLHRLVAAIRAVRLEYRRDFADLADVRTTVLNSVKALVTESRAQVRTQPLEA